MEKVIIVGGGASGLVAAIMAARNGAMVLVLERNKSCGKKLLVTGNGKCNYFNSKQDIKYYHSNNFDALNNIINKNNLDLVINFFDSIGVIPRIKDGYYYPYSNQAVSVFNAIINEAKLLGVKIINEVEVKNIIRNEKGFVVSSNSDNYSCDKVIMAMGSYAYYKNVNVNSYELAERMGHNIIKPRPALVQLVVNDKITKNWAGVRVNAKIGLYSNDIFVREEVGEILFTSYGISGICAMQVSRDVAIGIDVGNKMSLVINFVPDITASSSEFVIFLDNYSRKVKGRTVIQILDNIINYKLGNVICDRVRIKGEKIWDNLSLDDKIRIAASVVNFKINVDGTKLFDSAQVCSGGVSIKDINTKSMESLIVRGLYFTGEMLDVDGDCGGYNLTFAWISGILAGIDSARGDDID